MMWMTVYIWWSDEKRKVIEAQWCVSTIWWEMNNFLFYALTSKNLKTDDGTVAPDFYYIQLDPSKPSNIKFWYSTGDNGIKEYKTLVSSESCRGNNSKLKFSRTWHDNISGLKINKWFSPVKLNESEVFYLRNTSNTRYLTWDILIKLCIDDNCNLEKEISKWAVDWRTQTISSRSCIYYNDDNHTCKTRDGCKLYDDEDITKCLEY